MSEDNNPSTPKTPLLMRPWPLLSLAVVGALFLFLGVTGVRIVRAAPEAPAKKAGVIAIFGAAQDAGRPSPVYRARLGHGCGLFRKGMAPAVLTTRGSGEGSA